MDVNERPDCEKILNFSLFDNLRKNEITRVKSFINDDFMYETIVPNREFN